MANPLDALPRLGTAVGPRVGLAPPTRHPGQATDHWGKEASNVVDAEEVNSMDGELAGVDFSQDMCS